MAVDRNEQTSARVAALAASILRNPDGFVLNQSLRQTIADLKTLAGSCLTQTSNQSRLDDEGEG